MDKFELQQASAEQMYSDGMYMELLQKLKHTLPLLTRNQKEELAAIVEVDLRETIDAEVAEYADNLPF